MGVKRQWFRKLVFAVAVLFVFAGVFSCTPVHDTRIKIIAAFNNPSKSYSQDEVTFELQPSSSSLNLSAIGFPVIQYNGSTYFGYRDNADNVYLLLPERTTSGTEGYPFYIDSTDYTYNSSLPLNFKSCILYPKYTLASSTEDSSSSSSPSAEPVVRTVTLNYAYNDPESGRIIRESISHTLTSAEIQNGATIKQLGLSVNDIQGGSADGHTWIPYDEDGDQDRLFSGYVDLNDHNKAYYYAPSLGPLSSTPEFYYRDQDGNYYIQNTLVPTDRSTVLTPLYLPAGYKPISDYFGKDNNNVDLTIDSVFIPGSYNEKWPYEGYLFGYGNDSNKWFEWNGKGGTAGAFDDRTTDGKSFQTKDMLVQDMILTRRFLYRLFYNNSAVTTTGSEVKVVADNTSYTFTPVFLASDTNAKALYHGDDATGKYDTMPATFVTFGDAVVLSNLLTHLYNLNHTSREQLEFVYYADENLKTPMRNVADANATGVEKLWTKYSATGFRLPLQYEFSYMARIITDERQIPTIQTNPTTTSEQLILTSDRLGTKYAFKSVKDSTFTDNNNGGEWQGTCAGLSQYNTTTGEYDRTILRKGWLGYGRTNSTQVWTGDNYHSNLFQKYSYGKDPTTTTIFDLNTRNGAGLFNISGTVWQWCNTWFAGASAIRVLRGGAWYSSASSYANHLRLGYVGGNAPSTQYSNNSARLCRTL